MKRSTPVWKLVLTFFLPPLIYTDLIKFRSVLCDSHVLPSDNWDSIHVVGFIFLRWNLWICCELVSNLSAWHMMCSPVKSVLLLLNVYQTAERTRLIFLQVFPPWRHYTGLLRLHYFCNVFSITSHSALTSIIIKRMNTHKMFDSQATIIIIDYYRFDQVMVQMT